MHADADEPDAKQLAEQRDEAIARAAMLEDVFLSLEVLKELCFLDTCNVAMRLTRTLRIKTTMFTRECKLCSKKLSPGPFGCAAEGEEATYHQGHLGSKLISATSLTSSRGGAAMHVCSMYW